MSDNKRVGRAAPQPNTDLDRQKLGFQLREAREYLRLSQDEVAKALDLPRTAISMMESGQRKVDALELKRLAEIYQRSISQFTGSDDKQTSEPEAVRHLARAAAKLTDRDREELLRFAEFLQARAQ